MGHPSTAASVCSERNSGPPNRFNERMFTPLDILLGAVGVLIAAGICAPFLLLRRRTSYVESVGRPVPIAGPAPLGHDLQQRVS